MTENFEKIREYNIIWDFAEKYDFIPQKSYPMEEVYKNISKGFIIKTFDLNILDSYFDYLRAESPFFEDFKLMANLLMEDIAYKTLKEDNLVIESLRIDYARKTLRKYNFMKPMTSKNKWKRPIMGRY